MPAVLDRSSTVARRAVGPAMPVIQKRLKFDADGYPEWWADVRLNARGQIMDAYRSREPKVWWRSLGKLVLDWNFCDEDGAPIALPGDMKPDEKDEDGEDVPLTSATDLPEDLVGALLREFNKAFNERAQPPKEPSGNSTPTSTTTP